MSEINIDLLRKDECQPLTNEQMTGIKSQFHPVKTVNVSFGNPSSINYYINPQTGVDDIAEGYGLSADKPFASIEYALSQTPSIMGRNDRGELFPVSFYLQGNFVSSTVKELTFEFPNSRVNLYITDDTTFENYILYFRNCGFAQILLYANLTMNITNTAISSSTRIIRAVSSKVYITQSGFSSANPALITINGNATSKSNLTGVESSNNSQVYCGSSSILIAVNQCRVAYAAEGSTLSFYAISGSNNTVGIRSTFGMIFYHTSTISATTATQQTNGGQIFYS